MAKAEWNAKTLAQSDATEQVEGNHYFPREDVDMQVFEPSEREYTCPWKGEAEYFHIRVGDERLEDAAWSYPQPKPAAEQIAGHIAFDMRKGISVS